MQTCSIIWNYSSYKAGVFVYKVSRRGKHKWHCTIGFLILFFRKEYILFSNVYISVNTIFECCYLFFGWEIGHRLSTCATEGMEGGHPKCVQVHTGAKGYHSPCVLTHLQTITLFIFLSSGVLSIPSLERGCFLYIRISTKNRHSIFLNKFLTQLFVYNSFVTQNS